MLAFEERLRRAAGRAGGGGAPPWALEFAGALPAAGAVSPRARRRAAAPRGRGGFAALPTCDRGDLNRDFVSFVPDGEPLDDLIVYETAGTTGHPVTILSHPLVSNLYLPLLRAALADRGVALEGGPGRVAIALVCAQSFTYTYASVSSYLGGAGFVKVNLNPLDWRDPADRAAFLDDCAPAIYSGDPLSFLELLRLPLRHRPQALVSTSMALAPGFARELEGRFGCPVLDLYSLNECRLVAAAADPGSARRRGHRLVPHDVHVEILDAAGRPVPEGERGEITLTCGAQPLPAAAALPHGRSRALERRHGRAAARGSGGAGAGRLPRRRGPRRSTASTSRTCSSRSRSRATRCTRRRTARCGCPCRGPRSTAACCARCWRSSSATCRWRSSPSSRSRPAPASSCPTRRTSRTPGATAEPGYRAFTFREIMHPGVGRGR